MDIDGDVRVCCIENLGTLIDARSKPGVCRPGQYHLGALRLQVCLQVLGDVEVELRFGISFGV